ncbi:uncharacterized protein MYCFIDRAFT_171310 [Pseudocercospora fijiensis CIRAD86]|uniref:Uncharacterized protein n=1 Tax=Pseudocercospora fijiensis (strain CIRAD86) TaxID=383855 RepID=M3ALC2_PSEFD|nr:uncharacterized protein MYCFIDRAFT_171310 [Pseudocercospora fijiensis CIRAD86]EME85381.1 hypothetical protein MYCFIDRAFT_171310 [Pseudocercospora fijiensis CIRAD86]
MARPTKAQQFAIYEDEDADAADSGIPSPDPEGDKTKKDLSQEHHFDTLALASQLSPGDEADDDADSTYLAGQHGDADDERRQSAFTSTSISSLPESAFETDYERGVMHKPYTPPSMRPTFRRPESVRRMQMSSPTPSVRNLRRSVLSPPRARTPRSTTSSVKGSPRPKRLQEEDIEEEKKDYPLVLLHITLLPVKLRWSYESMRDILPANILEDLQLLRSKTSETIIQRGILIPHPREEYELLEERLLEALELKKERITKCGHFRARDSISSTSSADSGVGSSVEGSDSNLCETCHHHLRTVNSVVSTGGRKWSIKVFAANGLMKAPAWAAGWSEMERVDVEILPWINDDLRKRLDARRGEEDAERRLQEEDEEARIRALVEEQVRIAHEEQKWVAPEERRMMQHLPPTGQEVQVDMPVHSDPQLQPARIDLPQVYRPKDIPLALLLKNYIFLLAQDRRNIAVFALSALAFWLSLRAAVVSNSVEGTTTGIMHTRSRSHYDIPLMPEMDETAPLQPVDEIFLGRSAFEDLTPHVEATSTSSALTPLETFFDSDVETSSTIVTDKLSRIISSSSAETMERASYPTEAIHRTNDFSKPYLHSWYLWTGPLTFRLERSALRPSEIESTPESWLTRHQYHPITPHWKSSI